MSILLQHPTGNGNVRALLTGLAAANMLSKFCTTIATDPKSPGLKLLPSTIRREFLRRTYDLPPRLVYTKPVLELLRMIMLKSGLGNFQIAEQAWTGIDAVYTSLDKHVAKNLFRLSAIERLKAVYAYEDGALHTFIRAKELGLKCIYDLPIAYWELSRSLLKEEAERLPSWAITLAGGITDSPAKLARKSRELELADFIVAPSQFVMDSLPNWSESKKGIVAPFGSPALMNIIFEKDERSASNLPLRVLFVGSMSQRKGLGDLFAAFSLLKNENVELVVMGSAMTKMDFYRKKLPSFVYEAGRPHHEVLELMQRCDVLCLPSIVEGRALVMQEAMSQGLPIIITPNTGGEDLIKEGTTGFLIPIRSPEKIAEKISWLVDNRKHIPEMGRMAQKHALKYSWSDYSNNIIKAIESILD